MLKENRSLTDTEINELEDWHKNRSKWWSEKQIRLRSEKIERGKINLGPENEPGFKFTRL